MESDELLVVERSYCDDESKLSVGLANIHAAVPDVEANKDKILRAASIFKERGVNIAVFPEFCLSGYFWDARDDCWPTCSRPSPKRTRSGSTPSCSR